MTTEKEKMRSGQLANVSDPELMADLCRAKKLIVWLNSGYIGVP